MATQPILETTRLSIVPATSADLDVLWALWRDPDVRRFLFDNEDVTRARASEVLNGCLEQGPTGRGLWLVYERASRMMIGCVGLMPVGNAADHDRGLAGLLEPIVALDPSRWGRGHATEALAKLVAYGFEVLDLPRIAGVTDVPNLASHRMLLRAGFVVRGECDGPCYRLRTYMLERPSH